MNQQLIYTSAPKGLRVGSRGFTTVASTPGMAKNLAERLEALSGYRHIFAPNDPKAHLNPVNYSYVRTRVGGRLYYVLSRIADAGLDHTQRTNKIAHHITVDPKQIPGVGPAWLESQENLFEERWDKDPQIIEHAQVFRQGAQQPTACHAWEAATGDAGWAGVWAASMTGHTKGDAYLIYDPGLDLLPLFLEAQGLLSPELRWAATFSTYYNKLPPGTECRWRGVVRGSHEALHARKSRDNLVLDLNNLDEHGPRGPLVEYARTGIGPLEKDKPVPSVDASVEPLASLPQDSDQPGLPPPLPAGRPKEQRPPLLPKHKSVLSVSSRKRHRSRLYSVLVVAICGLLIFAAGSLTGLFWFNRGAPVVTSTGDERSQAVDPQETKLSKQQELASSSTPEDSNSQIVNPQASSTESEEETDPSFEVAEETTASMTSDGASDGENSSGAKSASDAAQQDPKSMSLPSAISLTQADSESWINIGSIGDQELEELEIRGKAADDKGFRLRHTKLGDIEMWKLDAKGNMGSQRLTLGELRLSDGKLFWRSAKATQSQRWLEQTLPHLEYSLLVLKFEAEGPHVVAFREPTEIEPLHIKEEKQGLPVRAMEGQTVKVQVTKSSFFENGPWSIPFDPQQERRIEVGCKLAEGRLVIAIKAEEDKWQLSSQLFYDTESLNDVLSKHSKLQGALRRHLKNRKRELNDNLNDRKATEAELEAGRGDRSNLRGVKEEIAKLEASLVELDNLLRDEIIPVNDQLWEDLPETWKAPSFTKLLSFPQRYCDFKELKDMSEEASKARIEIEIVRQVGPKLGEVIDLKTSSL